MSDSSFLQCVLIAIFFIKKVDPIEKKRPRQVGAQYDVKAMPIALLAPFGVRMPPPLLINYFFHCTANMAAKIDFTKFFYITEWLQLRPHPPLRAPNGYYPLTL